MKLIGSTTSPYVRKVHIALLEKALPFEFMNDSPWDPATRVTDFNPLGKVPALVTDSGETFFDSTIISAYIETLGATPPLLPADPLEAVRVRQTAALGDGVTDAGVAILLESRRATEKQDAAWSARQLGKLTRGLDALEARLTGVEYFHGNSLSLADIAVACGLLWLDFRNIGGDWRSGRPALTAQIERLSARPSFLHTVPVA